MNQAYSEHGTGPLEPRIGKRCAVIGIEYIRQTAVVYCPPEQLLAGPGVLVGEEPAGDQQPGVVVDDEEQTRPDRGRDRGERDVGADEHVGDPAIVRVFGLVAAEHLRLGDERLSMEPPAPELLTERPLGDRDAVAVVEDRGELGRRAGRELEAERSRLVE